MSEFNKETQVQIAHAMLATGTGQQKIEALKYASASCIVATGIPDQRTIVADGSLPLSEVQLMRQANELVRLADKHGFVLTIEQVSSKPLAMGNYNTIPTVRRKNFR